MNVQIYYGNLKECVYSGCAGNFFGVEHDKIIKEGVYFVKTTSNKYILLEDLMANKKSKITYTTKARKKGDLFVGDLVLVNDIVEALLNPSDLCR